MPAFIPGANTHTESGLGVPAGQPAPIQTIAGDGAITVNSGLVVLSKASAAAITIALPDQDGQWIWVVTSTAQAHVITQGTDGFNAKGSSGTATFTAAIGNGCLLFSQGGHWWALVKTGVAIA